MTEAIISAPEVVKDAILAATASFHAANQDPSHALDEHATHDARIAMRRLRSILRTYASMFDERFRKEVGDELRWYGSLLGAIRDLDVTAERLQNYLDDHPGHNEVATKIREHLEAEQRHAIATLRSERLGHRYQDLLHQLDRLDEVPPVEAQGDVHDELVSFMRGPYRQFSKAARIASRTRRESDLHELRIRAKELRYAAELSEDVLGRSCHRLARRAQDVQDAIGNYRDGVRSMQFLEEFERFYGQHPHVVEHIAESERAAAIRSIADYDDLLDGIVRGWRRVRRDARHRPTGTATGTELADQDEEEVASDEAGFSR